MERKGLQKPTQLIVNRTRFFFLSTCLTLINLR